VELRGIGVIEVRQIFGSAPQGAALYFHLSSTWGVGATECSTTGLGIKSRR
jgi:hypothetical protein